MQQFATNATKVVLEALSQRFPATDLELLSALAPQYWRQEAALPPDKQRDSFSEKLNVLAAFYCTTQARIDGGIPPSQHC